MTTITHREDDELLLFLRRHCVGLLLVAATLAFLLPFGTVSCSGETVRFTGVELASRHVQPAVSHEHDSDGGLAGDVESSGSTIALMALVFAIAGAASATYRGLGGGFSVAALLSLLLLLLDAAFSFADLQIEAGFWLVLCLVVAAVIVRARSRWRARRARRQLGVQAARPPLGEWLRRHAPSWLLGAAAIAAIVLLDLATTHAS